jgi:predicted DCC family thiol-disulfide oxidoreductase YuxK
MSYDTLTADRLPAAGSLVCPSPNLVLYDGVCGLCHRLVRFLVAIDRGNSLCFAPLQGATATRLAERHGFSQHDPDSVVYVRSFGLEEERVFYRSDAVLAAIGDVGGLWWIASWARILPRFLRDGVYRFVARRRYRWFGRFDSCPAPPRELRGRFLP